jgi:hypothetical protein
MMADLAKPMHQPQTIIEIAGIDAGGILLKSRALSPTGLDGLQKMTPSVTQKRARNLDAVRFEL